MMPDNCERCGKPIEKDGYCAWQGKWWNQWWLCQACIELDVDCLEADADTAEG